MKSSFSSIHFSCSVVSDSLRPHEPQRARPPCPSPTPGVHKPMAIESVMPSNHLILCHPLLLLLSASFPASGAFLMSRLFASGGHSTGASASVLQLLFFLTGLSGFSCRCSRSVCRFPDFSCCNASPHPCHGSTKAGDCVDSPGPRPEEVTARPGPDACVMVSRGQRGAPGQAGAGVGRLPGSQRGLLPPGHHLCPGRARAPGWLSAVV